MSDREKSLFSEDFNINKLDKKNDGYISIKDFGAKGDGITNEVTFFSEMLTKIGSKKSTILIEDGTYKLSSSITIPSNISLRFARGAKISVDAIATLTINGGIEAEIWQIFSGNGTVNGSPKITHAYAEWFGATTNDTSVDNAPIIMKAMNFFHVVKLTKGVYYLNTTIILPYGASIIGIGRLSFTGYDDTTVFQQGNVPAFTFATSAVMVRLDGFNIKGNPANPNNDGVLFNSYGASSTLSNLWIYQCGGNGISASGAGTFGVDLCGFYDLKVDSCSGYGIKLALDVAAGHGFNTSVFELIECTKNQLGGFYIDRCSSLTFIRCHSFWNESSTNATTYGYRIESNALNIKFISCWAESNGEHSFPDPTHRSGGFLVNGGKDISFDSCHVTAEDRGFIINGGTNIIIDKPFIDVLNYPTAYAIFISSSANQVHVTNYNHNATSSAAVANFSSTSYIESTTQLPTTGRIPYNTTFKRGMRGNANCYTQGSATIYQYSAIAVNATSGDNFLTMTLGTTLRVGDNILIPSAGASGAGLFAQVTEIDLVANKIIIDKTIVTSITGQNLATVLALVYSEMYATDHSDTILNGLSFQEGDKIWTTIPNTKKFIGEGCTGAGTGGSGGTAQWKLIGSYAYQTSGAVAITTGATISPASNVSIYRVSPASAVTGIILTAGISSGQEITILNEAVSGNSVTFAASSSNISDGSSNVISGGTARKFVWNGSTSLWYRIS